MVRAALYVVIYTFKQILLLLLLLVLFLYRREEKNV